MFCAKKVTKLPDLTVTHDKKYLNHMLYNRKYSTFNNKHTFWNNTEQKSLPFITFVATILCYLARFISENTTILRKRESSSQE